MGKKPRGAALRAKKRAREAVEEIQEQQAQAAAQQSVTKLSNEQLFCLDTAGDDGPASAVVKKQKRKDDKANKYQLPAHEQAKVDALVQRYNADELIAQAQQGSQQSRHRHSRSSSGPRLRTRGMWGQTKASFDLWGTEENVDCKKKKAAAAPTNATAAAVGSTLAGTAPAHVVVQARTTTAAASRAKQQTKSPAPSVSDCAVAVDVARSGQSYHPDAAAHAAVLQDAVAVEKARQAALDERAAPISQGMSAETRALLVGDSDSEDDDDDDNRNDDSNSNSDDDDGMAPVGPLPTRAHQKTRAQRNKEKRHRQLQAVQRKQKQAKKLVKEISQVHRYKKEFKRETRSRHEKKMAIAAARQKVVPGKDLAIKWSQQDPIHAPTFPVALPSEVAKTTTKQQQQQQDDTTTAATNRLRTIQPKGSLAADRLASLQDRNLAPRHGQNPNHYRGKRRKKAVKGARNNEAKGKTFIIKG